MKSGWLSTLLQRIVIWLRGCEYVFTNQKGMKHVIRARSEEAAKEQMRFLIRRGMFGDWALIYDPAVVERELNQLTIRVSK